MARKRLDKIKMVSYIGYAKAQLFYTITTRIREKPLINGRLVSQEVV